MSVYDSSTILASFQDYILPKGKLYSLFTCFSVFLLKINQWDAVAHFHLGFWIWEKWSQGNHPSIIRASFHAPNKKIAARFYQIGCIGTLLSLILRFMKLNLRHAKRNAVQVSSQDHVPFMAFAKFSWNLIAGRLFCVPNYKKKRGNTLHIPCNWSEFEQFLSISMNGQLKTPLKSFGAVEA